MIRKRYTVATRRAVVWELVRSVFRRPARTLLLPGTEYLFSYWVKQSEGEWVKVETRITTPEKGSGYLECNFESGAMWGAQVVRAGGSCGAFVRGR